MIIRPATIDDALDLLNWRNDPVTMKMSLNQNKINLKEHTDWLSRTINDNNIILYISQSGNENSGMVRFDRKEDKIEASININPDFRGKGLAYEILSNSIDKMQKKWTAPLIEAKIRKENKASIKLFKKCGFKQATLESDILIFMKNKNDET